MLADRPHLLDDAAGLARELGGLPLALAQAAAFMLDRDLSCAVYRARWADRRRRFASLLPEAEGLPDEHARRWPRRGRCRSGRPISWSRSGLAGVLLEIASVLDANGIPVDVFTADPLWVAITPAL